LAVVDALWSQGIGAAEQVLAGMAAASLAYGVPIVGGHTNTRSDAAQLAVSIVGRAKALLSSFNAKPGDSLMMAVDLRGRFEEPYPFWNASVDAPPERLRGDLELLPQLAESGLCDAAKDISMAGTLGTALMLLECSEVGARVDLARIPAPEGVPLERWVTAFPSFGYLLSVRPEHVETVQEKFSARSLACSVIGSVDATSQVVLHRQDDAATLWDFQREPFIVGKGAAK
jgi:AIR synthase-related protein